MGIRVKRIAKKDLENMIEDYRVEGYKLTNQSDNLAVMKKHGGWGTIGWHIVVFFLTVWFSLGLGNLLYALWAHYSDTDTVELKIKK